MCNRTLYHCPTCPTVHAGQPTYCPIGLARLAHTSPLLSPPPSTTTPIPLILPTLLAPTAAQTAPPTTTSGSPRPHSETDLAVRMLKAICPPGNGLVEETVVRECGGAGRCGGPRYTREKYVGGGRGGSAGPGEGGAKEAS